MSAIQAARGADRDARRRGVLHRRVGHSATTIACCRSDRPYARPARSAWLGAANAAFGGSSPATDSYARLSAAFARVSARR
jgi:hypothetical protein